MAPPTSENTDLQTLLINTFQSISTQLASNPSNSSSSNTFSMEFLCRLIPNTFDGNRFELGQFLANCNNANQLASDDQKNPLLFYILSRICGKAKEPLSNQSFDNWDELKSSLKILYQDKKHYVQLMEELNNCKQNSKETINEFFQRLETIVSRLIASTQQTCNIPAEIPGKLKMLNEIALNRFVYHSKPEISQMLRWKDFDSLNSVYSAAVSEERAIAMTRNLNQYCKNCKTNTHDTRNCFKTKQYTNTTHVLYTNNQKICRYCKNKGHTIEECRKRQFNNSKTFNNSGGSNQSGNSYYNNQHSQQRQNSYPQNPRHNSNFQNNYRPSQNNSTFPRNNFYQNHNSSSNEVSTTSRQNANVNSIHHNTNSNCTENTNSSSSLNSNIPSMVNTPLEDQIKALMVFEN